MNKSKKFPLWEILFLLGLYIFGVSIRLIPRLDLSPYLLTFSADIWYRLCLAQYVLDHGHLPVWDIRYEAYGQVPVWYNPLAVYGFVFLSRLSSLDLATVTSRLLPFIEAASIIPFYFLCRYLFNVRIAVTAAVFLGLTPTFVFWTGIATPQSFTLFLMPFSILLWVRFTQKKYILNSAAFHLAFMGVLLAVNFLTHLTYFNHIIILLLIQVALIREKQSRWRDFFYLLIPIVLSQVLTAWWWLPT